MNWCSLNARNAAIAGAAAFLRRSAHCDKHGLQLGPAPIGRTASLLCQSLRGVLQRDRRPPCQVLRVVQADHKLNPDRQRMASQRDVGRGVGDAGVDGLAESGAESGQTLRWVGCAFQALADDGVARDPCAEETGRHLGHGFGRRVVAGHGGGGADADGFLPTAQPVLEPSDQHCHVGTLPTAIGVQLVQNDEVQIICISDDCLVQRVLPRHQQLEHHEVRQQDVRLRFADPPTLGFALLPGVAREGRP